MSIQVSEYDPQSAPPPEVVDVLERGLVEIVRRLEIYEADAETRWNPNAPDAELVRLIEGNVTVDYNSDERRKLDVTLENIDQSLRPNPNGGFWYDKVLKPFYGVVYSAADAYSPLAIIESPADQTLAVQVSHYLSSMGYDHNEMLIGETDMSVLKRFSHIVSVKSTTATDRPDILKALYAQGKTILTIGVGSGSAHIPLYSADIPTGSPVQWGIQPVTTDTPTSGSFVAQATSGTATGRAPTGTTLGATALARWTVGATPTIAAAIMRNGNGGFWIDIHLPNLSSSESRKLLAAVLSYVKNITPVKTWETQMGEYYIDRIDSQNFPDNMKVTARDGTKKMMNDKLARNSTFAAGVSLRDLVAGQAALSGIPASKLKLDMGDETLASEMSFNAGTSRWDIVKSALESFGYERFFDAFGNFVVRKFLDPSTSPVAQTFGTGPSGNLVSFQKSVNDSRIYNLVRVTAAPSDGDPNPIGYFGEAEVTDVSSPVHWSKIGRRVLPIDAPWVSSDVECAELAQTRLKVSALESYELSFESIYYPWLEAGEIVKILDPDALSIEPDRFLMDSISYPLSLGPMSATAKRVTFVGSPGGEQ